MSVHHGLRGEIATGAVSVLDYERLAETFRKPLRDQPRDDVGSAAGDGTDDQPHWASWIRLGPSEARDER